MRLYLLHPKIPVTIIIEDENAKEISVAYLNQGDFFGEMEMLGKVTRIALVKAKTKCEVAELGHQDFIEISQKNADILKGFTTRLAESSGNLPNSRELSNFLT